MHLFLNGIVLQGSERITAISTSSSGSTSEFSDCINVDGVEPPPPNCTINLGISNFNNETCAGNDGTFTLSATMLPNLLIMIMERAQHKHLLSLI